jgi:hypothetical protein
VEEYLFAGQSVIINCFLLKITCFFQKKNSIHEFFVVELFVRLVRDIVFQKGKIVKMDTSKKKTSRSVYKPAKKPGVSSAKKTASKAKPAAAKKTAVAKKSAAKPKQAPAKIAKKPAAKKVTSKAPKKTAVVKKPAVKKASARVKPDSTSKTAAREVIKPEIPEKPVPGIPQQGLGLPEGSVYQQTGHRRPLIVFPK